MDFKSLKNSVVLSALLFSVSSFANGSIPLTKGWQIVGANNGYTTSNFNDGCIKFVWAYDKNTGKWLGYSPDSDLQKAIKANGYKTITTIKPNQGFWINSYGNCKIAIKGGVVSDDSNVVDLSKGVLQQHLEIDRKI